MLQDVLLCGLWLEYNIEGERFKSSLCLINLKLNCHWMQGPKCSLNNSPLTHICPSPGNWMIPSSLLRCSLLLMGRTRTTTLMLSPSRSEAEPWTSWSLHWHCLYNVCCDLSTELRAAERSIDGLDSCTSWTEILQYKLWAANFSSHYHFSLTFEFDHVRKLFIRWLFEQNIPGCRSGVIISWTIIYF